MNQLQIGEGIDNIKMTVYLKLKKYCYKIDEKLPFSILSEACNILVFAFFWAAFILTLSWTVLGVHPLRLDETIIFISVTLANILAYRVPVWFPTQSRFMEVTCEVILFSISEIGVVVPTAMNAFWCWSYFNESRENVHSTEFDFGDESVTKISRAYTYILLISIAYVLILLPLMNTAIHSAFIYHLMRKLKYTSSAFCDVLRAAYCILGVILVYGLTYPIVGLEKSDDIFLLLLVMVQFTIFFLVSIQLSNVEFSNRVKKGKCVKWMNVSRYSRIVFFAHTSMLLSILIPIVILFTKYEPALAFEDAVNHFVHIMKDRKSAEYAEFSAFWPLSFSIITGFFWSLIRNEYVVDEYQKYI